MAHMENPLASPAQLHSRSNQGPIPSDLLDIILYSTQCLTQAAGMLLGLPQSASAQASVILARYWLVESPMDHDFSDVSAAALFLVAKMGDSPKSTRDLSNVYTYLLSPACQFYSTNEPPPKQEPHKYYQTEDEYLAFQTRMLSLEARIFWALSFDTHVSLPHPLAVTYLQTLDFLGQPKDKIGRRTAEYLNTALLSPQMLYLTHQPHALATAAIYNAAKDIGAKAPDCAWWEVFDVDREELGFLVVGMRSLESWVRAQRDEFPTLMGNGCLTRDLVATQLENRGFAVSNGNGAGELEDDLMRKMDAKMSGA